MDATPGAAPESQSAPPVFAPLSRRAAALLYEALLLAALLWCAALVFGAVERAFHAPHVRLLFQMYLFAVTAAYFVWQWSHGGQTLPMKTWRIRLLTGAGSPVSTRVACVRYLAALAGLLAVGIGFLWALVDRDRQFLHDRAAGTRIVRCP